MARGGPTTLVTIAKATCGPSRQFANLSRNSRHLHRTADGTLPGRNTKFRRRCRIATPWDRKEVARWIGFRQTDEEKIEPRPVGTGLSDGLRYEVMCPADTIAVDGRRVRGGVDSHCERIEPKIRQQYRSAGGPSDVLAEPHESRSTLPKNHVRRPQPCYGRTSSAAAIVLY